MSPASRKQLRKQHEGSRGGTKITGTNCNHTGMVRYAKKAGALAAAGEHDQVRSCGACRGWHVYTKGKRR